MIANCIPCEFLDNNLRVALNKLTVALVVMADTDIYSIVLKQHLTKKVFHFKYTLLPF